ncbi:MAG: hypothetical protein ACI38U_03120 [Corynebacterium sp.]|uniref:phage gene 29 protein family protein n=1 Tax=Corynebacterium sp. TaxID=1720 RepID=UPI003F0CE45B
MALAEQEIYPYPIDDSEYHPRSWMVFNAPGTPRPSAEVASNIMRHLEKLGVDLTPGVIHASELQYDALGSAGAPWEHGIWIPADESRAPVTATAVDKEVTAMTPEERAELQAALDAAEIAASAGALHNDETREG